MAQCSNRSPYIKLFVRCLEVTGELLKIEKFELQFLCLQLYKLFVSVGWPLITVPFCQIGVEQLSSLQHLDLAYNLLLEHSQLSPLSLLHCLNTVRKHTDTHTHTFIVQTT